MEKLDHFPQRTTPTPSKIPINERSTNQKIISPNRRSTCSKSVILPLTFYYIYTYAIKFYKLVQTLLYLCEPNP